MITRTYSVEDVTKAVRQYASEIYGFYPEEWLASESNIALTDNEGNICLFEREFGNIVTGHYFFEARGKKALDLSYDMLKEIFTGPYNVDVIRGLTPITKLGARWLSTKIGFKSYGVIHTHQGPCILFILTKEEWENANDG